MGETGTWASGSRDIIASLSGPSTCRLNHNSWVFTDQPQSSAAFNIRCYDSNSLYDLADARYRHVWQGSL